MEKLLLFNNMCTKKKVKSKDLQTKLLKICLTFTSQISLLRTFQKMLL